MQSISEYTTGYNSEDQPLVDNNDDDDYLTKPWFMDAVPQ
jgi:hypothetical protein